MGDNPALLVNNRRMPFFTEGNRLLQLDKIIGRHFTNRDVAIFQLAQQINRGITSGIEGNRTEKGSAGIGGCLISRSAERSQNGLRYDFP